MVNEAWIPLLILAVLLLAIGLVGRVVGAGRHCATCRYDLAGGDWGRCPECAADLASVGAVVLGRRVRRPGLVWAGSVLCGLSILALVPTVVGGANGLNPYWWQPNWLMRLSGPRFRACTDYVDEFQRRLDAGEIGSGERAVFAARAERVLRGMSAEVGVSDAPIAWANVLAALWRNGDVSDERAIEVLAPALFAGPQVSARRASGRVRVTGPFDIARGGNRLGAYSWFVDGERLESHPNDFHLSGDGVSFDTTLPDNPEVSVCLAIGTHGPQGNWDKTWVVWLEPVPGHPDEPRRVRHELLDRVVFEERMRVLRESAPESGRSSRGIPHADDSAGFR